ncbi:hypothetical protein Gotri_022622 [Gossypium trilobum]|uniref:ABC-2 type transporter transmembrane domain-containing protein n=1 Tax=Gossypium trilobum TaxID=34281 RepID=A0A7J9DGM8_9ROSI|nr:hypothetical protein [Gossypium trilobum]
MGASGAGKTTLLDVLSGRKTGGYIERDIMVEGYPKVQQTYAMVSGFCEQTDVHSLLLTLWESVMFSAWLRLSKDIPSDKRSGFVAEVLQMIELEEIKDALFSVTSVSGLSAEQRKWVFMDEPTSDLDARAAAIVMRVLRNIASTRRTIVCTIHQPSIDIFEAFDEIILRKRGGEIIYSGELGQCSSKLIEYFEVTNPFVEAQLGVDFSYLYKQSHMYPRNNELDNELKVPKQGSKELCFTTRFPQNGWEQFKTCLWKQHLSYWRNPAYSLGHMVFSIISSLFYGMLLWNKGQKL